MFLDNNKKCIYNLSMTVYLKTDFTDWLPCKKKYIYVSTLNNCLSQLFKNILSFFSIYLIYLYLYRSYIYYIYNSTVSNSYNININEK